MATINSYLTFNGNCEEAFNFYKSVFGGEFRYIGRFDQMPDVYPVSEDEKSSHHRFILPPPSPGRPSIHLHRQHPWEGS